MLEVGTKAPAFSLPDQNGTVHTLEDYKGKKVEEKFGLPFTLLSDTELVAIQAYDVWREKNMYGKTSMGVVRTTYLIDENGVIAKAFGNVKAAENPAKMLAEV